MSVRFFVFMTLKDGRRAKRFLCGEGESVTCFNFCATEQEYEDPYRKLILPNKQEIHCLCEANRYVFQFSDFCGLGDDDYWVWAAGADFGSGEHQLVSWQSENEKNQFGCFKYILSNFNKAKAMVPLFTNRTWSKIEGFDVFRIKCVLGLIDPLNYRMVKLAGNSASSGEIELKEETVWPVFEMLAFAMADQSEWEMYKAPDELKMRVINDDRFTECLVRAVRARRFTTTIFHFYNSDKETGGRGWASKYNVRAAVGEMYPLLAVEEDFRKNIQWWCVESGSWFDWWVMNNRDFSAFIGFGRNEEHLRSQCQEMIVPFVPWMLSRDDFGFLADDKYLLYDLAKEATPVLLADFPMVVPSDPVYLESHPLYKAVTNWTQAQRDAWTILVSQSPVLEHVKQLNEAVKLVQEYSSRFTGHWGIQGLSLEEFASKRA